MEKKALARVSRNLYAKIGESLPQHEAACFGDSVYVMVTDSPDISGHPIDDLRRSLIGVKVTIA